MINGRYNFFSFNRLRAVLTVGALAFGISSGVASAKEGMSLEKAAQKTNNPVSDAWLLITQNDYTAIDSGNGTEMQERFSFQPVMPIPIMDGEWNLVNRVVAQWYNSPYNDNPTDADDFFGDRTSGFGDTIVFSLAAPDRNDGFIWGVGPTFILPTASDDLLGQEKWQAGPAALAVRLGNSSGGLGIESWNIGMLAQHWWSVSGDDDRSHTEQSDIQYFVNWKQDAINLIGMTPNISIDWTKSGSDRFSVPIGIGKIGFMRWGTVPVRWGIEIQRYVMQPDPVGPEWNLKIFIAPVAANPFK